MNSVNTALLANLMSFEIGPTNVQFTFADRLARENNWSKDFALRAIIEYKRFIYLIATTQQAHTPSDQVDQVWHLHMTYTQSYWEDMCDDLLNCKIHHGPTRGGQVERTRYAQQYQQTLDAYQAIFGKPSHDIWPSCEQRFKHATAFSRVNTQDVWLLPKPSFKAKIGLFALFAGVAGTTYASATNTEFSKTIWFLVAIGFVVFITIVLIALTSSKKSKHSDSSTGSSDGGNGAAMGSGTSNKSKGNDSDSGKNSSDSGKNSSDSFGDSGCGSGCGGGCGS